MTHRIAIVSPSSLASAGPAAMAFGEVWPQADVVNVVDESLYADYVATRVIDEGLSRRLELLLHYSETTGAQAALFTGSVFGAVVEKARAAMRIPVLASYEAMIEAAFAAGPRLAVVTTSLYTMPVISEDIRRHAEQHGLSYTLASRVLDDAREAFRRDGDIKRHFELIAEAARDFTDCDALMLGQTSMDPAYPLIEPMPNRPVLTPLRSAAPKLRTMLTGA